MSHTQPFTAIDALYAAWVVLFSGAVLLLLVGCGRALYFYFRWLRTRPLIQRLALMVIHVVPFATTFFLVRHDSRNPTGLEVFLWVTAPLLILMNLLALAIGGMRHVVDLVPFSITRFWRLRWWWKLLTLVVPIDIIASFLWR